MTIETLFDKNEIITMDSYLTKCGVKDLQEYYAPTGKYIDPPFLYKGINLVANEVEYWINYPDSKIVIVQDGDGDGVCSAVILYQYLTLMAKKVNSNVQISVLIHTDKQRGLNDEMIMDAIREKKPQLVIVPDAGTNDYLQAEELCDLGIGLVVLDHHDYKFPTKDTDMTKPIEKGYLINNQDPNNKVQRNGSGALVTHKLLQFLDNRLGVDWSSYLIDMVALSLVSDSMLMTEMENRTYYHFGLETADRINNPFLKALFDKFIGDKPYTQRDISFKIVPKLNAVCRHTNQDYKQQLFLAFVGLADIEEALQMCEKVHKEQIAKVNDIIENNKDELESITDNNLIVFASDDIPRSYSGLVCGKVMNYCGNKPSIVGSIRDGVFIGSVRSPIPLRSQLDSNDLVEWANGHEESCGISIKAENLQPLVDYYNTLNLDYTPHIEVLQSYSINCVPKRLSGLFGEYEPLWTDRGLPRPMFHIYNIVADPTKDIKVLGKDSRTLKIEKGDYDIMFFRTTAEDKEKLGMGIRDESGEFNFFDSHSKMEIEVVGTLSQSVWRGQTQYSIIVDKYEVKEYTRAVSF